MFLPPRHTPQLEFDNRKVIAGAIIPLAIATIFIVGRCYSRVFLLRNWGWDDSMIICAWIASTMVQINGSIAGPLTVENGRIATILVYLTAIAYQVALFSTKLSISCSYLRIIPQGKYRALAWGTTISIVCGLTPLLIASTLACDSQTGYFFFNHSTHCVPFTPILYASSALQTVFDAWLIILIIPFIVNLKIHYRQKAALVVILSGGVLVIAANIARIIVISNIRSFNLFSFALWSSIEINLGIICASAPTTLPLLRKIAPRAMAQLTSGKTDVQHGYGITTQLSRIRERSAALELCSVANGSRLKSTAERSTGSVSANRHWGTETNGNDSQEDILMGRKEGVFVTTSVTMEEERKKSSATDRDVEVQRVGKRG